MTYRTTILQAGKTATGLPVPDEVIAELGGGKKPAVQVNVSGYMYRTTVGSVDGRSMIPLSADHRAASGLAAGDEVEVTLELDTAPRELVVPADFAAALTAVPAARAFFDSLSYSNRRRFTLSIDGAKTAETRERRIAKAVQTLAESRIA